VLFNRILLLASMNFMSNTENVYQNIPYNILLCQWSIFYIDRSSSKLFEVHMRRPVSFFRIERVALWPIEKVIGRIC